MPWRRARGAVLEHRPDDDRKQRDLSPFAVPQRREAPGVEPCLAR